MKLKTEEYQQAVDEDRRLREERRARVAEETRKFAVRNKAAVRLTIFEQITDILTNL